MTPEEAVEAVASAPTWDARIAAIRLIPEQFGTASHQEIYSTIARRVYVPSLAPDFAYVHWDDDYELPLAQQTYQKTAALTLGFSKVALEDLASTIGAFPPSLRVFRLILGFTAQEFAAATALVAEPDEKPLGVGAVRAIESGAVAKKRPTRLCAAVIDRTMRKVLFGSSPTDGIRLKTDKPDTVAGWDSVRSYASGGVPFSVFLHQRQYGGAFRQLLDATSTRRGDVIEDAVEEVLSSHQIPFVRTGSDNQAEIEKRFGLTVPTLPQMIAAEPFPRLVGTQF